MGSRKRDSTGKLKARRPQHTTRRATPCNMAEVRREIVNALHLHGSSSSSSSSYPPTDTRWGSTTQCFPSLLESMPLPEPIWSTTAPSVFATPLPPPPPPPPPLKEALGFDWKDENLAASYNWWLGFLKTLDGDKNEASKYPCEQENMVIGPKLGDPRCLGANGDHQNSSMDEWLTIPTPEDECEMMM